MSGYTCIFTKGNNFMTSCWLSYITKSFQKGSSMKGKNGEASNCCQAQSVSLNLSTSH